MQQDANKTIAQLSDELMELRQRNIELEALLTNKTEAEEYLRAVSEKALEKSESKYRELFNNSKNAIVIYEAIDDGRDFIFREFNHAAENIEHLKMEALIGKFLTEVFPGVKEFGLLEVLQRVWKTGKAEYYPIAFYHDERISGWRANYAYKLPSGEIVVIYEDITERKQAEEALQESEERFRTVAESSPDAILIADQSEAIIFWNTAAAKMFGYQAGAILGKSYRCLLPERLREQDRKAGQRFLETGKSSYNKQQLETIALRKDGKEFPVEITYSGWKTRGQYCFSFIIRDITERKRAEQDIINAKDFLENIYNTTADVIMVSDEKGYVTNVNRAIEKILGFTQEELIGKHTSEFFPKDEKHAQIGLQMITDMRKKGFIKNLEANWLRKDGSLCPIELNITRLQDRNDDLLGGVATIRDITERKQQEENLRESAVRFRTIAEASQDAIITADSSGKILYWNKAAETMYGYTVEEILGKSIELLRPKGKRLTDRKNREIYLKTGQSPYIGKTVEGEACKKDGTFFLTETSTSSWTLGGQVIFGGIVRDITKRKQMEEKLRKSHAELEKKVEQRTAELRKANEKLHISQEYLKKFSGMLLSAREEERKNISKTIHDELGSMSIAVDSQISIAREECNENNKQATFKALTKAQAALRKAVEDLRRIAVDLRPPNLEIMGMTAAITELIDKIKQQAKFKITFRNELSNKKIPEDTAIVIYRIIQEALTNSYKHSKAKTVRIRLYADIGTINMDIADDGIGCDLEKVLYIKGKPRIGVEGMKERVESLGGEFLIKSAPKKGTQLKVTLPKK